MLNVREQGEGLATRRSASLGLDRTNLYYRFNIYFQKSAFYFQTIRLVSERPPVRSKLRAKFLYSFTAPLFTFARTLESEWYGIDL